MKIPTLIATMLILTTQPSWAQAKSRNELSKEAGDRSVVLAAEWASCDKLKAEGDNLECNRRVLAAYETEIARLTSEVRSTLPKAQRESFDTAVKHWHRYFTAEKKHLKRMNDHLGTVSWIGLNADLVAIAKARCDFLWGQIL